MSNVINLSAQTIAKAIEQTQQEQTMTSLLAAYERMPRSQRREFVRWCAHEMGILARG